MSANFINSPALARLVCHSPVLRHAQWRSGSEPYHLCRHGIFIVSSEVGDELVVNGAVSCRHIVRSGGNVPSTK